MPSEIAPSQAEAAPQLLRAYLLAWGVALVFYFLEYAVRSAPSVMIPELATAFNRNAVGVSAIIGSYYYTYAVTSLIAGVALDRSGAKYTLPVGVGILGIGCLLFALPHPLAGYCGRLLQGAGSAFAFPGAVYLASRGFSPRRLATAIGVTQCLGMLGGSAGQFVIGPLIKGSLGLPAFWTGIGIITMITGIVLLSAAPRERQAASRVPAGQWIRPYRTVFSNGQSYLCGAVSGLLFAPTTVFAMTWGIAFFHEDLGVASAEAVVICSMVPLGWVAGCPLLGWLADRIGRRKPVLLAGMLLMITCLTILLLAPLQAPAWTMACLGLASGAAMIPYTIIKEANPDEVKGSATGAINFITFGVTALIGPLFGYIYGRDLLLRSGEAHFRQASGFWIACIAVAAILALFLKETGGRRGMGTMPDEPAYDRPASSLP